MLSKHSMGLNFDKYDEVGAEGRSCRRLMTFRLGLNYLIYKFKK